uniref:Uncharacterized protein n=1 Tax=Oryza sativa subsp. japonica TaxID=39947 RepID=Q2QPE0_ORYSJ|nr:hypothetical protein LOC_Os12g34800 [Oryza sativa Japonica Group]
MSMPPMMRVEAVADARCWRVRHRIDHGQCGWPAEEQGGPCMGRKARALGRLRRWRADGRAWGRTNAGDEGGCLSRSKRIGRAEEPYKSPNPQTLEKSPPHQGERYSNRDPAEELASGGSAGAVGGGLVGSLGGGGALLAFLA